MIEIICLCTAYIPLCCCLLSFCVSQRNKGCCRVHQAVQITVTRGYVLHHLRLNGHNGVKAALSGFDDTY